jgi:hypothetical protein
MNMKRFKEYVFEDYDYERNPNVPKEIYDANDHLVDLVTMDTDLRKKNSIPGNPLMYDMRSLNHIHRLYLGIKHPEKYPEYAKRTKKYIKALSTDYPHLSGHILPPEEGETKSWN